MTKILRNITKYKECQNLMDSGVLCLETLLKTYYNKTQFLRKNNVEDCRKEDFAKNDRVLSEQSKKSGKCMKGEKNGIYRNYEGYDNRRIVADQ